MTKAQYVGLCGERWVAGQIEQLGLRCRLLPDFMEPGADIIVEEQLRVEVKYAHQTSRRRIDRKTGSVYRYDRWQWNLQKFDGMNAKVLVLVAEDISHRCYPFVLPAWMMIDRPGFQITSHPTKYRGLLADFLENWRVLTYILNHGWERGEPGPWAEVPE